MGFRLFTAGPFPLARKYFKQLERYTRLCTSQVGKKKESGPKSINYENLKIIIPIV